MSNGDGGEDTKLFASSKDYKSKLMWVAVYQDGETILQYDEDFISSSEAIDHQRLSLFHLVNRETEIPLATLRILPGQRFFYRSRTAMRQSAGVLDRIHIMGWRKGDQRAVLFVSEADMSVELGDFVEKEDPYAQLRPWLYDINWRDIDDVVTERCDQQPDTKQVSG
jgi:hypothetical protein